VVGDKEFKQAMEEFCPKFLFGLMWKMRKQSDNPRSFFGNMPRLNLERHYLLPLEELLDIK
jgi:hypothetical protein